MDVLKESLWSELGAQGALDDIGTLETNAAAELSRCVDAAYGIKPRPYGALITSGPPPHAAGRIFACDLDVEQLRRIAEGRSLVVCRSPAAPAQLLRLCRPLRTDVDSEALVAMTSGVLARADAAGGIRFVRPDAIAHVNGQDTWTRPHIGGVIDALASVAPAADLRTLTALVHLAYLHVSPSRVGATVVYQLTGRDDETACFSGVSMEALRLNIRAAAHASGILHQIEHRDGAVVFSRSGLLRRAGVILVPSPGALRSVGAVRGGTRHHSAAWHSCDRPDVVCFVVSRAGRVTVFSRGQDVSPGHVAARRHGHRR